MVILLSEDRQEKAAMILETCLVRIKEFLDNPVIGYSRFFFKRKPVIRR